MMIGGGLCGKLFLVFLAQELINAKAGLIHSAFNTSSFSFSALYGLFPQPIDNFQEDNFFRETGEKSVEKVWKSF